jgi:hypothetical protein
MDPLSASSDIFPVMCKTSHEADKRRLWMHELKKVTFLEFCGTTKITYMNTANRNVVFCLKQSNYHIYHLL